MTKSIGPLTLVGLGAAMIVGTALASPPGSYRSIDGSGNNIRHPEWGSVGTQLLRLSSVSYADGASEPAGPDRPGARAISNAVCAQLELVPNPARASDFLWQWGQFIDHDITLVDPADPAEPFDIPVPPGDPFFDPDGTGEEVILLDRSTYDPLTGDGPDNPRQQVGSITTFIDASQVYGSDEVRVAALRTLDDTGLMKTSPGRFLPFNVDGLPNFGGPDPTLFLAGDIRANEQVALSAMHTLWVREHNRLAERIRRDHPRLSGEEVYQRARAVVGAEIQVITYREFLPILIGSDAIGPYRGYDRDANPGIANVFATGAYRVGHTLLSPVIRRTRADGEPIEWGHLPLREAFFAPERITEEGGIAPILRGLASQMAQNVDPFVIDDVRNFLFGEPGEGGFDLPSLNLQRGRDHGLPGFNQARVDYGLEPIAQFSDICSDAEVCQALEAMYGDVDEIDVWIGGLAEDHVPGALVGELFQRIIADQFRRLRDGDRFWHQRVFSGRKLREIEAVRLADVIRRNTEIAHEIADDVFRVAPECIGDVDGDGFVGLEDLLLVLAAWGEPGGPADLNGDGIVNVLDLLIVIANLGPC